MKYKIFDIINTKKSYVISNFKSNTIQPVDKIKINVRLEYIKEFYVYKFNKNILNEVRKNDVLYILGKQHNGILYKGKNKLCYIKHTFFSTNASHDFDETSDENLMINMFKQINNLYEVL